MDAGYTVVESVCESTAHEFLNSYNEKIDLLLIDVVLPNGSGLAVARAFQNQHPDSKVIFTSGYIADPMGHHGILGEEIIFLPKPFLPEDLKRIVPDTLDG